MPDLEKIDYKDIYCTDEAAKLQPDRYARAAEEFTREFGINPQAVFSAPGRTEIGGNHTDHQHGEVLAASINSSSVTVSTSASSP